MIVTIGVMLVTGLLLAGAFEAANADIHLTQTDTAAKKAYYAAQAGISSYAFHLNADFNYWTYCNVPKAPNESLNLYEDKPLKTRTVPGTTDEKYAIQLLPSEAAKAAGKKCETANPVGTMIENGAVNGGTFRIESTGYSGNEKRTILATFAHTSFLNFLYYTEYETPDPSTYEPPEPACQAFASERPGSCESIQFVSADVVNGPIHTEDTASICGTPTFGSAIRDRIEFKRGSVAASGCSNSATYKGKLIPPAEVPEMKPPPSNAALKAIAGVTYTGKTIIVLEGENMKVTNGGTTKTVSFPTNGVVYVTNKSCSTAYTPYGPSYSADGGCGNVYVSGNYSLPLTIAAENDIVINGNLTPPLSGEEPTSNAVLGLVANNFVRIYHPVGSGSNSRGGCSASNQNSAEDPNKWGTMEEPKIYAAILAVNHSFIVDNFRCGSALKKLVVHGAIAQIFRGTVGTHNNAGEVASGYAKSYGYDYRLEVESPPYFLNPLSASWVVKRAVLASSP